MRCLPRELRHLFGLGSSLARRGTARGRGPNQAALLLVLGSLLTCTGCKSQAERDAEAEIARIAFAVGQLRDAANNEKNPPLSRLRAEQCSVPAACELQQVCVQAYTLHLKSIEMAQRVRQALREGTENTEAAATLLSISEKDLAKARTMMDQCVTLEGQLAREAM